MATQRLNNGSSTKSGSTSLNTNESWGSSDSSTNSGSSSDTHSHSSTNSYSNTHSEGGSQSQTSGESRSVNSSTGGNRSTGSGVSWASGQVSDQTQQKFNQATQDYVRSQNVEDAYANLQNAINSKPAFQSKFEDKLNDMYDKIMNREAFTYDFNKDAMYQQYKDQYLTQGRRAMQDTMGQLAAMNNGYGSSYAQTAGQQTYQNYLQQLYDRIPELRAQALEEYDREGNRLNQQYQLTNDAYNREYGQYRDQTADWQSDRSFNQSAYQDERNFDYNKAMADRNFWQNEYWQEKNAAHSNLNESEGTNWNEGQSYSQNRSQTDSRNWSDSQTRGWSETDTDSHTDTSGWSNTHTDSYNRSQGTTNTTGWSNTSGWQDHFYQPTGSGSSSSNHTVENTVPWTAKNTGGTDFNSANLVQQLYYAYKDGGDNGLNEIRADLKANGLVVGDTKYTFTDKQLDELETQAKSKMSQMRYYGYKG